MTPLEAIGAVVIFWIGLQLGRRGEQARRTRLGRPSIYQMQNEAIASQQFAAFNSVQRGSYDHILTGPLAPWQVEMMERDQKDSP